MSRGIRKFNHPETEESGPTYSGILEIIETDQIPLLDQTTDGKKPFVIYQVLNESQMSDFKSHYADGKLYIHLTVLKNNGDAYILRPEVEHIEELTKQEYKVLTGLAEGLTYPQIAEKHYVDLETVKSQVDSVYKKLIITNKTSAAIIFKDYISNKYRPG